MGCKCPVPFSCEMVRSSLHNALTQRLTYRILPSSFKRYALRIKVKLSRWHHQISMGFTRTFTRLVLVITAVMLGSCIDSREEIWINADGSGRVEVSCSLPAAAARLQGGEAGVKKLVSELLQKSPALKSSSCEVSTEADRLKIHVKAAFASALDFKKAADSASFKKLPPAAKKLKGEIKAQLRGLTLDYSRTIKAGEAILGASFIPASQFKNRNLTYIIHLPVAASESNATSVTNGGRTLTWDFPLAQAIQRPVITRFTAKIPIPTWVIIVAAAITSLALVGLFYGIRKLRQRKHSTKA
jgi:hypothetical protein